MESRQLVCNSERKRRNVLPESRRDREEIRRGVGGERRFELRDLLEHRNDDLINSILDSTRRIIVSFLNDDRIILRLESTVEQREVSEEFENKGMKSAC